MLMRWVTAGLEEGINNMCLNEKAWIRCMSDRYQTSTSVVPGVPSSASAPDGILYIVTLHHFMQVRNAQALPDAMPACESIARWAVHASPHTPSNLYTARSPRLTVEVRCRWWLR